MSGNDPQETTRELTEARRAAVDAALHADELEAQARKARRIATARMKHYEDLVMIHQGQMTLPYER
jgi:hypothetical protein